MTTAQITQQTTQHDLRERLARAKQELQDAESAVGAAVLDDQDDQAAAERVAAARANIARLKAALAELDEREEKASVAELERETAIRRWRELAWYAEYVERIQPVIELREQLAEAEARVMALPHAAGARRTSAHDYTPPRAIAQLRLPANPVASESEDRFAWPHGRANDALLTVEQLEEAGRKLAPLVEEAAQQAGADAEPEDLPWSEGPGETSP